MNYKISKYTIKMSRPIRFTFAAHVDHGKSTICGHLLYKTGYVTEHEMDELRRQAVANKMKGWEYAYVLDIDEDERKNGKTGDYCPIEFNYNNDKYVLVDNAGHKSLVRTLIAGLSYQNPKETVGCLVTSVADNEYEAGIQGGQTRESAKLLRAVGIEHLIVVLNKIDLYGVDTDRYKVVRKGITDYVSKLGFKTINYANVSGFKGDGLLEFLSLVKEVSLKNITESTTDPVKINDWLPIQVKILYEPEFGKIISAGFQCILHNGQNEYQVELEKIKHFDMKTGKMVNKGPIVKNGDVIIAKIKCSQQFKPDSVDRVILRQDDHTIGFGKFYIK